MTLIVFMEIILIIYVMNIKIVQIHQVAKVINVK
jgi:hypothetical protein